MKVQVSHLEHNFAAREKGRYALNGCIFTPYGVVSTDGRRLHETKHHEEVWTDQDCSAVYNEGDNDGGPIFPINDPLVKAFLKLCKPIVRGGPAFCVIRYDDSTQYFHMQSEHGPEMGIPALQGQYPDWETVLPKRGGMKMAFDAQYLKDTAHLFCKTDATTAEHNSIVLEARSDEMQDIDGELHSLEKLFPKSKESAGKQTLVKARESLSKLFKTQESMRGNHDGGIHLEQNGHYSLLMPVDADKPHLNIMTDKKRTDATNAMRLACGLIKKTQSKAKADVAEKRDVRKSVKEKANEKADTKSKGSSSYSKVAAQVA
ncbi:hypothetical protein OAU50_04465 [Planctomycetota bacterium]|nr:hypothetical protein [Planctomycetota bacterium]